MRMLIIGDVGIIFTFEFILRIASRIENVSIDVLNFSPKNELSAQREAVLKNLGCRVFYQPDYKLARKHKLLHTFIRLREAKRYCIARKYDVVNVHYIGADSMILPYILRGSCRLIVSIYGSDLLRAGKKMLKVIDRVLHRANAVTVASESVGERLSSIFKGAYDGKTTVVRYGAIAAEDMHKFLGRLEKEDCKRHFGLDAEKTVVLCGYNAAQAQRHFEILDSLSALEAENKNKLLLMFHCSYGGNPAYIKRLKERLAEYDVESYVETRFLQGEELARFRKAADVFINVQPTDVLSASMIEEMEAGAICVKGEWLKYPDLDARGCFFLDVESTQSVASRMTDILERREYYQSLSEKNAGVWKLLSWDDQFEKWRSVICPKE